ncbi:hypothetical protein MCC01968_02360 [Bifidobacteriaceae bacterium MCC01968]|nr:hypothetical protein MCC01961_07250 [Bifidobacteriaceae bacterium MCC01961]GDZ69733.1 hypothetical protein MCC02039_07770 [Bifidobacteriaceae bacterium MCC02039]GDZ81029.1 hypothetical protein MCC01968_02360 [Bifidobacteriaceae bacterium MCC01968]
MDIYSAFRGHLNGRATGIGPSYCAIFQRRGAPARPHAPMRLPSERRVDVRKTPHRPYRNSDTPRRAMQNALPSHVCLEFGHTAPSLGAF